MIKSILACLLLMAPSTLSAGVCGGKGQVRGVAYVKQIDSARVTPLTATQRRQALGFLSYMYATHGVSGWVAWLVAHNAEQDTTVYSVGPLGTHNGTMNNGPTWGSTGLTFVRTSTQSVSTSLVPDTSASPDWTFFVTNNLDYDGGGSNGVICTAGTRAVSGSITPMIINGAGNTPGLNSGASYITSISAEVVRPSGWHTVCATFQTGTANGTLSIGVNGGTFATNSNGSPAPTQGASGSPFYFGATGAAVGNRNFNGVIGNCVVFSKALTQAQYTGLHNAVRTSIGSGLLP